jgi:hypothetical protein
MAVSTVETIIANPARKRSHMARRMTLKQRLHFGTARQRAAAKASLRGSRKRKRNTAHRKRTSSRPRKRTQNPGEIIALTLGNPARKKGRNRMAATKRRRRHASKTNAGHRHRRKHTVHHRRRHHKPNPARRVYNRSRRHHTRRHHNPAGYSWGGVFELGAGAVVGSALSSAGTQLVLGTSNTGMVGYAGNLISTLVLSWLGSMGPLRKFKGFGPGILAGGVGALIKRIISDYSLFGGYTASLGMGDYMVSNWVAPQRLVSDFRSLTEANVGQGQWGFQGPPALAMSSSGVSTTGMGIDGQGSSASLGY